MSAQLIGFRPDPAAAGAAAAGLLLLRRREGVLWSLLLLRFSLCSCFGQEGGFFPPARRSGHIGIEAFRHIHIHRHRDIVKNANIRTNGFNRPERRWKWYIVCSY